MHKEAGYNHHFHSDSSGIQDPKTVFALLNYMLEHNQQHEEELHNLIHQLTDLGFEEAATAAHQALDSYRQGNADLARAVALL